MINKIKVCEIFPSIQGEGAFAGYPMLFIRLSGCTRFCSYCDTKYHNQGKVITVDNLIKKIKQSKLQYVCWTGGEPLLWRDQIEQIIVKTKNKLHHIETNADLLIESDLDRFDYLAISPKDKQTAEKVVKILGGTTLFPNYDIKVVTDLEKTGIDLISYATMIMPLSTYTDKDLVIQQKVWNYCVKNNLKFTPRYQFWVWGQKRSI